MEYTETFEREKWNWTIIFLFIPSPRKTRTWSVLTDLENTWQQEKGKLSIAVFSNMGKGENSRFWETRVKRGSNVLLFQQYEAGERIFQKVNYGM